MMARWAVHALLFACVSSLFFIRSDSVVEKQINLSSVVVPLLRNIDAVLSRADRAGAERRPDPVVDAKTDGASAVSLPLPFIVYSAYNEYQPYERPIDVIADSLDKVPIASCREEVKRAADVYGLSYPQMMAFALIESSCQPTQRTGSYIGVFQLSQFEFKRYGRSGGDVYNMRDNVMAAAHKFIVEAIDFEHAVGRYPTAFDRYCIHQQGLEGCIQHQSQPDRVAWESMCATQEGKTKGEKWCRLAIWGNVPRNLKASIKGGVAALTSGEFLDIWRGRVGHFTKIMTGIREANAGEAGSASEARTETTSAIPDKPQAAEKPEAKKTQVAEKPTTKKAKVAEKSKSKKSKVAEKAKSKKTKVAAKSSKKSKVADKATSKKAPSKKISQTRSRSAG